MTFDPAKDWCRQCGKLGCACPYCHGLGRVTFNGRDIPCDACNPAPEPEERLPAPTPIRQRPGRSYTERLEL